VRIVSITDPIRVHAAELFRDNFKLVTDANDVEWARKWYDDTPRLRRLVGPLSTPVPAPPPSRDLLRRCDLAKDPIAGRWRRVPDGLESNEAAPAKMRLPFDGALPAEYDFETEFTPLGGELTVTQIMSAFGKGFGCDFGGWGNTVVAFQLVDGKIGIQNRTATRKPRWLEAGRRHVSLIQVRRDKVSAFLNGEHIVTLPTNYRNLGHRSDWAIPSGEIGIGSWRTPTIFHRATLVPRR
jgi:hypothetical protein